MNHKIFKRNIQLYNLCNIELDTETKKVLVMLDNIFKDLKIYKLEAEFLDSTMYFYSYDIDICKAYFLEYGDEDRVLRIANKAHIDVFNNLDIRIIEYYMKIYINEHFNISSRMTSINENFQYKNAYKMKYLGNVKKC